MNKPNWPVPTLHILREGFFYAATIIIVLFVLAVAILRFFPPEPLGCDPPRMPLGSLSPAVESLQPVDVALNRSE